MHPSKRKSVKEMAGKLIDENIEVEIHGSEDYTPTHLMNIENADVFSLTFYIGEDASKLTHLKNCVLVCRPGVVPKNRTVVRISTNEPKLAFYILAQDFAPEPLAPGIHPTAIIDPKAAVEPSATIGPYCVLEECTIAKRTVLHSHVAVYKNSVIGARVVIEANTTIGTTGQGWAWGDNGNRWMMPQVGGTVIGDDCFIGSNVSIARGAMQDTIIDSGCRIGQGSRIGHNCFIGKETFLSSGVSLTGSVKVGKYCFLGSSSVIQPGITLGDIIMVGAGSNVTKSFPNNRLLIVGMPARVVKQIEDKDKLSGIPKFPPYKVYSMY